jgi:hypothetical protein
MQFDKNVFKNIIAFVKLQMKLKQVTFHALNGSDGTKEIHTYPEVAKLKFISIQAGNMVQEILGDIRVFNDSVETLVLKSRSLFNCKDLVRCFPNITALKLDGWPLEELMILIGLICDH